ncbi:MAG: DinB family protein [Acidimicrobiales bacterium]|nr:DinB family protein [Acidimicrobiales bacterium]
MAERDWVRVVAEERCEECGLTPSTVARDELGPALRAEAAAWSTFLLATPAVDLRRHDRPDRWSPLECAAHTRDTLGVFAGRIERALVETEPVFGWWDHEAAVVDERYNEQAPDDVARTLMANAHALAVTIDGVAGDGWERAGTRRAGERFTVEGLARFALHEARHHRGDAGG